MGVQVEEPRGGGSHYMARHQGRRYPIALHNGLKTEVDDIYIRGIARGLGLDIDDLLGRL